MADIRIRDLAFVKMWGRKLPVHFFDRFASAMLASENCMFTSAAVDKVRS